MDVQGAEAARPWHKAAGATFPTLVDRENLIGRLYGLKAIPYVLLINESGQLVKGPMGSHIDDEEFRQGLVQWLTDPNYESEALAEQKPSVSQQELSPTLQEADLRFRLGLILLKQGDQEQAVQQWRKALTLDPGNWIIHKQIWAVEHPERFYEGSVDYQWQKEQLEAEKTR